MTSGIDALANTRVTIAPTGSNMGLVAGPQGRSYERSFSGSGADEDIVVSSARAYVSALNKMIVYLRGVERKLAQGKREEAEKPNTAATAA